MTPNAAVQANALATGTPSYTVATGGINGGQQITVGIPFTVCAGQCVNNPGNAPYATGVIVGSITQVSPPSGGTSAAYTLSSLCVEVDGVSITDCSAAVNLGGVTTTGQSPVDTTPIGGCGALVCLPSYFGLSGSQLATIYVPGTPTTKAVYGPGICLFRSGSTPPPGAPDPCTA